VTVERAPVVGQGAGRGEAAEPPVAVTRRVKRATKRLLGRHLVAFTDDPAWSIAVYAGPTPRELRPLDEVAPPVISRREVPGGRASFVADPFGIRHEGRWFLFYEVLDLRTGRGEVAVSVGDDLHRWEHLGRVLREPFHLSYPQVFAWEGEHYLVPEAATSGAVRLYRAREFPRRWDHVADLVRGPVLLDPTLFHHAHRWWMYVETSPTGQAGELRLFSAPSLLGPWGEHPASPLVTADPAAARPAGRVVRWDGALHRLAQDCSERYGGAVDAWRIEELTEDRYVEAAEAVPLLRGSGAGWNATAMHHLDLHRTDDGWVAFVDGHGDR
jgi:hypothetical protein